MKHRAASLTVVAVASWATAGVVSGSLLGCCPASDIREEVR